MSTKNDDDEAQLIRTAISSFASTYSVMKSIAIGFEVEYTKRKNMRMMMMMIYDHSHRVNGNVVVQIFSVS